MFTIPLSSLPIHSLSLCFLNTVVFLKIFIYLFGCTGSQLWPLGSSVFVACVIFSCGMWDLHIFPSLEGVPCGSAVKKILLPMQETQERQVWSLSQEDSPEKEMATHSSILAWKISQTEEPGRLQSMGLQSQIRLSNWARTGSSSLTRDPTQAPCIGSVES